MKAISTVTILALIAWVPATPSGRTSVQPSAVLATPLDAVSAVLDAFAEHRVVALGEGPHGNEQGHAFRMKLIQDPRFAERVNDILVEFGSGKYQSLMDRFVQGDLIARDDLKRTWQDTTASGTVWDRPIYEEFFQTVRAVNLSLPKDRQLRVLLGDAPIDWSLVHSHAALRRWGMQKDAHAAALIKNGVFSRICG
jgi:erythromycin esterase-like protein